MMPSGVPTRGAIAIRHLATRETHAVPNELPPWDLRSSPPGQTHRLNTILLTDLLTDGASRGVIHRHRPSCRIRETPVSEHYWALTRTNQHPPEATHNPKVGGSNPPPATNEIPCKYRGFRLFWDHVGRSLKLTIASSTARRRWLRALLDLIRGAGSNPE
jgi:hypothetical protein